MNPVVLAELRRDGVNIPDDPSQDAILAALEARIIREVTSFERERYERLMRTWQELSAEREGDDG